MASCFLTIPGLLSIDDSGQVDRRFLKPYTFIVYTEPCDEIKTVGVLNF